MKKLLAVLAPIALVLSACTTTTGTTTGTTAPTATQQLGMAAIKIAINAKCVTELNNIPAWHTATRVMTPTQKQNVQAEICGCVSEKAPQNVTAVDLATAAIDPAARATIVSNAVSRTINACVAEAVR
ncbi:MAG: hypothetical protein Q4F77_04925 [Acinetobacter sp.]|uniref:hypothetical protein n=1 Tax=Acinetobacter sp. TaxID=472 RepID=UPI0026E0122F|nr:hypothetical protein [Acinetobacter sp.]MDO5542636.1 hypothetical protein [Acinetobacter sp.]